MNVLSKFQIQNRYLFEWLVDLMAVVAKNEGVNKMNVNNCARMMAPNVYFVEDNLENLQFTDVHIASFLIAVFHSFI